MGVSFTARDVFNWLILNLIVVGALTSFLYIRNDFLGYGHEYYEETPSRRK